MISKEQAQQLLREVSVRSSTADRDVAALCETIINLYDRLEAEGIPADSFRHSVNPTSHLHHVHVQWAHWDSERVAERELDTPESHQAELDA